MMIERIDRRLSVAPMMAHTDRHFRYLLRLISRRVMLYTEMIPAGALLHGNAKRRLEFDMAEHPVGIQLGGSEPAELAACATMAQDAGYGEINLNAGCPSGRVREGRFGACLMAEPGRVAECIAAMRAAVRIPVSIKIRIGIDDRDSYEHLHGFVSAVAAAGCVTFVVHARKAWLDGLSPRQNRTVPPLRHDIVHRLKRDFPTLEIILNGGINALEEVPAQLQQVDGVMIGRAACSNPFMLAQADSLVFGSSEPAPDRARVLRRYVDYAATQLARGVDLQRLVRHAQGLFYGQPGAAAWRRQLGAATDPELGTRVFELALEKTLPAEAIAA